jgi:DNA polymerase-1
VTPLPEKGAADVLYIVDLSSWARGVYEAARPVVTSRGERVEVVRAVVSRLVRLLVDREPAFLAVAADMVGQALQRRSLWPDYKAGRPVPGEDYTTQIARLVEVLTAHRIPVYRGEGLEADDWIASLVARVRPLGLRVVVVSKDHDLWQLVDDKAGVVAWNGDADGAIGEAEVRARYHGLGPERLADLWALAGQSDEAPGVDRVGEKTAAALLAKRSGLEQVLERWDWEGGTLGPRLRDGAARARLGRELVTLRADAPLVFDLAALRVGWDEADAGRLRSLGDELGIDSMARVGAWTKQPLDEQLLARWAELEFKGSAA